MIRFKDINETILQEDIDRAVEKFYDYSFLLKEGREINEFNIKDAGKKAADLIKFAVDKTGDAAGDAARKIYATAAIKLYDTIDKLKNKSKDKKQNLILRILGKIIKWFIKNPKAALASVRVGLIVLSLIGSAIGAYSQSQNPDAFNDIFEKMGIDMDGSDAGGADALADQLTDLEQLDKLNDDALGEKISQSVSNMGMDVKNPEFLDKDSADAISRAGRSGGHDIAPTDLMNDPAYADYQQAMDIVKQAKGDDTVRRLLNLAKLDRMLDEQQFKGVQMSADVSIKGHSISGLETGGVVQKYDNDLFVSNVKSVYNGEVISSVKTVVYKIERAGETFKITDTKVSGLTDDIHTRVEQLTKGLDKGVVDRIFNGMVKFSDWNKSGMSWKKESVDYSHPRLMELAGISEVGVIQRGMDMVKKVVSNVAGKAQNFLLSLKNKLSNLMTNIGSIFLSNESFARLSDNKPHNFIIKDGKLIIQ